MGTLNQVFLVGRLGADPELRRTNAGIPFCTFSLATSRWRRPQEGEQSQGEEAPPDWHRVVAWRGKAETCSTYLRKGREVAVVGRIQYDKYTGKDGVTKYSTQIQASEVTFLGSKGDAGAHTGSGSGSGSGGYAYGGPTRPLVTAVPLAGGAGGGDDLPF